MIEDGIAITFPVLAEPPLTEEKAISSMMQGLDVLIKIGAIKGDLDEILLDYEVDIPAGYSKAILAPGSLYDASKLNTVGAGKGYVVPQELLDEIKVVEIVKEFSAASIQERLRISKLQARVRLRYMVMDYKRYYNQKKNQLKENPEQMKLLRNMFLQDLMGLFNEVLPYIEEGKQLNTLIGVSQVTPTMNKQARELSLLYRRALKSEKNAGQIPKSIYQSLKKAYTDFMNALLPQVFPGIEEMDLSGKKGGKTVKLPRPTSNTQLTEESLAASRTYSYTGDGRVKLF